MTHTFKFGVVMVMILIAGLELESWMLASLSIRLGALRFYRADQLSRVSDEKLTHVLTI